MKIKNIQLNRQKEQSIKVPKGSQVVNVSVYAGDIIASVMGNETKETQDVKIAIVTDEVSGNVKHISTFQDLGVIHHAFIVEETKIV